MADSVKLQIITPSKLFYEGDIELVIVRTTEGEEGFMAHHSWACKLLAAGGEMDIQEVGQKDFKVAAISGGFIDVMEDIVVYTDAAEWQEEIDTERALNEKTQAEEWLKGHGDDIPESINGAKESIARQDARVKVATGGIHKKK